jgi:hypothetical protein
MWLNLILSEAIATFVATKRDHDLYEVAFGLIIKRTKSNIRSTTNIYGSKITTFTAKLKSQSNEKKCNNERTLHGILSKLKSIFQILIYWKIKFLFLQRKWVKTKKMNWQ